jgi:hypothetical protein
MPKIVPRKKKTSISQVIILRDIYFSAKSTSYTLTVNREEKISSVKIKFVQDISSYVNQSQQFFPILIVNLQLKSL